MRPLYSSLDTYNYGLEMGLHQFCNQDSSEEDHIIIFCSFLGDPSSDPNIQGDPFKTIFVGRIVSWMCLSQCVYNSVSLVGGQSLVSGGAVFISL